jgi:hypothetical protein
VEKVDTFTIALIDDQPSDADKLHQELSCLLSEWWDYVRFVVLMVGCTSYPPLRGVEYVPVPLPRNTTGEPDIRSLVTALEGKISELAPCLAVVFCDWRLVDPPEGQAWHWEYERGGSDIQGLLDLKGKFARGAWEWVLYSNYPEELKNYGIKMLPKNRRADDRERDDVDAIYQAVKTKVAQKGIGLRNQLQAFAALRNHCFPSGHHGVDGTDRERRDFIGRLSFCPCCDSFLREDEASPLRDVSRCSEDSLYHMIHSESRFTCACKLCLERIKPALEALSEVKQLLPPYDCCDTENHCPMRDPSQTPAPWTKCARDLCLTYNPQWALLEGLLTKATGTEVQLVIVEPREKPCSRCHTTHWVCPPPVTAKRSDHQMDLGSGLVIGWQIAALNVGSTADFGIAHPAMMSRVGKVLGHNFTQVEKKNVALVLSMATVEGYSWIRASHSIAPLGDVTISDEKLASWESSMREGTRSGNPMKVDELIRNIYVHGGAVRVWVGSTLRREYNNPTGNGLAAPANGRTFTIDMGLPVMGRVDERFWATQQGVRRARDGR